MRVAALLMTLPALWMMMRRELNLLKPILHQYEEEK
jgi:hypothetical protein